MNYDSDVVLALLKYLYGRDLSLAKSSCGVCVKLLQAAHYYSMNALWEDALAVLEDLDIRKVDIKLCLELFSFLVLVRNGCKDESDRLKGLILRIVYNVSQ